MKTSDSGSAVGLRSYSWAALLLAAAAAPAFLGSYEVGQLSNVLVYFVAILGIVVISGYAGAPFLGQGAFVGIGAYLTAILSTKFGVPQLIAIVLTIPVGYLAGLLIGPIVVRLRGLYFAIATFIVALVFPPLVKKFSGLTGGVEGLSPAPLAPPSWWPASPREYTYYICLLVATLVVLHASYVLSGPGGRALRALRDRSLSAEASGVPISRTTRYAFGLATTYGCVAGGLYTAALSYVSPASFHFELSVLLYVGAIIGGLRSIFGALLAAGFLLYIPVYAEQMNPGLSPMAFGLIVMLVIVIAPGGLAGEMLRLLRATRKIASLHRLRQIADPGDRTRAVRETQSP